MMNEKDPNPTFRFLMRARLEGQAAMPACRHRPLDLQQRRAAGTRAWPSHKMLKMPQLPAAAGGLSGAPRAWAAAAAAERRGGGSSGGVRPPADAAA